jgi:MinD-like ATPase involved in chromosome partitioning or flagellar assembly
MSNNNPGQIITFYSFKGGTGRTMALANVACILAKRQAREGGKGVLMIDWDLEAPGLHRYFRTRGASQRISNISTGDASSSKPGLIDLFYELNEKLDRHSAPQVEGHSGSGILTPGSESLALTAINSIDLQSYITHTAVAGLSLLKAGSFNSKDPDEYSDRVNKFDWEALYNKSPHLIRIFAETMADKYAFILIDSRTGVTDISGICTMLLPEKLVVVFTPNTQSLQGGLELIRRATDYRKKSADLRPLMVFPLVSRVEANEPDLRHDWRFGNSQEDTAGYQPEFEKLLTHLYGKKEKVKLGKYFDEVQIQHIPRYAYGEEIAVLAERISDKFSLRRSYQIFASNLVESGSPWEGVIKDVDSTAGESTRFQAFTKSLRERLSPLATKRRIRTDLLTSLILLAVAGTVFSIIFGVGLRREQQDSVRLQQEVAGLKQQLPLHSKIEQVEISKNPDGNTEIFMLLSIKNYGTPTTAHNYSLSINHPYSRSFEFNGPPQELTGSFRAANSERAARPEDSIQKKTEQAIGTDAKVSGWLKFVLPLPDLERYLEQPGMRYVITFKDDAGKTYETVYEMF